MTIDRSAQRLASNLDSLTGKHDDGREGVVLTKIAQGKLTRMPFVNLKGYASGSGSVNLNGGLQNDNPERAGQSITLATGAGQGFAEVVGNFWGRMFGVRPRRHFSSPLPNLSVTVGGETRPMRQLNTRIDTIPTAFGAFDAEALYLPFDDLPHDGPWTYRIHLASDPLATTAYTVTLHGLLVEADKGYAPYQPTSSFAAKQAVTSTATAIAYSGTARRLTFYNTAATAAVVTLKSGADVMESISLAAGSGGKIEWPLPIKVAGYTISTDIASGVNMWALGEGMSL